MRLINSIPKKGFTLLETLVSLFLVLGILTAVATAGVDSLRFYMRQKQALDAQLRVAQALERMCSEIAMAQILQLTPRRIEIENQEHQKISWDSSTGRVRRISGSTAYFTLPEDPPQDWVFVRLAPNLVRVGDRLICVRNQP